MIMNSGYKVNVGNVSFREAPQGLRRSFRTRARRDLLEEGGT